MSSQDLVPYTDPLSKSALASISDDMVFKAVDFMATWIPKEEQFQSLEKFLFHGFDPLTVYKHFLKIREDNKSISDKQFCEDILYMVAIGVMKGNVSSKNISGLAEEGQKEVTRLISTYGLSAKVTEKTKTTAVTFPRVAQACPIQAVQIALYYGRGFHGPYGSSKLPKFFFTSAISSLVPSGLNVSQFILAAATCYGCDLTTVLKGANYVKMSEETKASVWTQQIGFTNAGFMSPLLSQPQRCAAMKFLGIRSMYKQILDVVKPVSPDSVIEETEWDSDMDTIYAIASGDITMQSAMPTALKTLTTRRGELITSGGTILPNRMSVVPRTSLNNYIQNNDKIARLFPNGIQSHDGIPFELADPNEDCSDLANIVDFEQQTLKFGNLYKDKTTPEVREILKNDIKLFTDVMAKMASSNQIDLKETVTSDGQTFTLANWSKTCARNQKITDATDSVGQDVMTWLAESYKDQYNTEARYKEIELHRLIFWASTRKRRDEVRATLL